MIASVIWSLPGVRETRTYTVMEEVKNMRRWRSGCKYLWLSFGSRPEVFQATRFISGNGEPMSDDKRKPQGQDRQRSNDHFEGRAVMKRDFSQPVLKAVRQARAPANPWMCA